MKSILITGITGLLGSNLARYIKKNKEDCRVIGLSRSVLGKFDTIEKLGLDNFTLCFGSVTDYKVLKQLVNDFEVNEIYHLAAQSIVRLSNNNPVDTYLTNVVGTANVLQVARESKTVGGIVCMSSDKYYGSIKRLPYTEDTAPNVSGVYEASKACSDYVCRSFGKTFDVPVISVRGANIFGPGDMNYSRLVPGSIVRALRDEQPILYSDVKDFVREFIYVEDCCEILTKLMLMTQVKSGESVNMGSGYIKKVSDFLVEILDVMGRPDLGINVVEKPYLFQEIKEQCLGLNRLKKWVVDLPQRTVLETTKCIEETVEWYKQQEGGV